VTYRIITLFMPDYKEHIERIKSAGKNGGKEFGATMAIAEFSEFLAKLAEDTAETTRQNLKLQTRVVYLTWAILLLTLLMLLLGFSQVYSVFYGHGK
jgi:hypothetical protein